MSSSTHLSYPEPSGSNNPLPVPPPQARQLLKERLFIGNLHPTVDEYTLLQVFSKYGKISKLDFLFHKSGPLKGKPRGYAFVEYASENDAARALSAANDKLLRGRKLVVTNAQQAPLDSVSGSLSRHKRNAPDNKPTTLSLIKSVGGGRSDATEDKIAKMEAKLRQMEQTSAPPSLVGHPSLPQKPIGAALAVATSSKDVSTRPNPQRTIHPLPALPLAPTPTPPTIPRPPINLPIKPTFASSTVSQTHRKAITPLVGVKIKKHKDS